MTDSPAPLLEARDVHIWRGEKHLLRGVSFSLSSGQFLQLVGPNGVGKTTLLRAACGLLPLESGEILSRGAPIVDVREQYGRNLGYLAHSNALKADLTARENLQCELALRGVVSDAKINSQLTAVGLEQCAALPIRVLSAGQRRRLALARLVLCATSLWILDEPTTNLDMNGIALVERLMAEHLQTGGAILAAAHHSLLLAHPATRTLELQL
jgi:heme exporter protein A